MSQTYIVFVRREGGQRMMYETALWPSLQTGDKVVCETSDGIDVGVDGSCICISETLSFSPSELAAVAAGMGMSLPLLRIIGKIQVIPFEYKKEPISAENTDEQMDG